MLLPLLCFTIFSLLLFFSLPFAPLLAQPTLPQAQADGPVGAQASIRLGVGNGLEDQVLAQLVLQLLQKEGYTVDVQPNLGSTTLEVHQALRQGSVDLAWSYVDDVLPSLLAITQTTNLGDATAAWVQVAALDEAKNQLVWLPPSAVSRGLGMVLRPSAAPKTVRSLIDLATLLRENDTALRFCIENEFYVRPSGLLTLETLYDFTFAPAVIQLVGRGEGFESLYDGQCDVTLGVRADSRIERWGLRLLTDPRGYFSTNQGAVVMRKALLTTHPALRDLLERLTTTLTEARFRRLLREAEEQPDLLALLADSYLLETGLASNLPVAVQGQIAPTTTLDLPIVLGAGNGVEQEIVIELAAWLLERAGYRVEIGATLEENDTTLHRALIQGRLGIIWSDIRTAAQEIYGDNLKQTPTDSLEAWARLAALDYKHNQLVWLPPAMFNRGPGLILRPGAVAKDLQTIADLAEYIQNQTTPLRLCVENNFYIQPTGLLALEARYGLTFDPQLIRLVKREDVLPNLRDGRCDVAVGDRSDTRITLWKLQTLADPEGYFPVSQSAFALRSDLLATQPQLVNILKPLNSLLTEETMQDLTLRVTVGLDQIPNTGDEENLTKVAENFLLNEQLVRPRPLVVGSNQYPLERFFGKMVLYVLQQGGFEVVDRTGLGDSAALRQALVAGEVDIAIDRTGPALAMHHRLPPVRWPLDAKRTFELAQQLDGDKGLIWLQPSPFNNVYMLFAAPELASYRAENWLDLSALISQRGATLTLCVDQEFIERIDGLPGVEQAYALAFPTIQALDMQAMTGDEMVNLLQRDHCSLVVRQAADRTTMVAKGYLPLEDSRGFFPYANLAPVVRADRLRAQPQIAELLTPLSNLLTEEQIEEIATADLWQAEDRMITGQIAKLLAGEPLALPAVVGEPSVLPGAAVSLALTATTEISAPLPITASLLQVTNIVAARILLSPTSIITPSGTITSLGPVAASSTATAITETITAPAPGPTPLAESSHLETTLAASAVMTPALPPNLMGLLTVFQLIREPSEIAAGIPLTMTKTPQPQVISTQPITVTPAITETAQRTDPSASPLTITHPIVVGSAADPLHQLLAQLYIVTFAGNGFLVIDQTGMEDMAEVRSAMRAGEIDFTVDFVGSALHLYHGVPAPAAPTDAEVATSLIKRLDEPLGILWLDRGEFQDSPLLLVKEQQWVSGVQTVGDLARLLVSSAQPGTFCAEAQFLQDATSGLADLGKLYGFRWPEVSQRAMTEENVYAAVRDNSCIVGLGHNRDWRVDAWRLHALKDDLAFFTANPVMAVGRKELLDKTPELAPFIAAVTEKLESETIRQLLMQTLVGMDGQEGNGDEQSIRAVAANFACSSGLLGECLAPAVAEEIPEQTAPMPLQLVQADQFPVGEALTATEKISTSSLTATIPVSATNTVSSTPFTLETPVLPTIVAIAVPSAFQVNVREAPLPNAPIIAILKGSSVLAAIGRTADTIWLRVLLPDGRLGWVFQATVTAPTDEVEKLPIVPTP